jgi:hypothetical protein
MYIPFEKIIFMIRKRPGMLIGEFNILYIYDWMKGFFDANSEKELEEDALYFKLHFDQWVHDYYKDNTSHDWGEVLLYRGGANTPGAIKRFIELYDDFMLTKKTDICRKNLSDKKYSFEEVIEIIKLDPKSLIRRNDIFNLSIYLGGFKQVHHMSPDAKDFYDNFDRWVHKYYHNVSSHAWSSLIWYESGVSMESSVEEFIRFYEMFKHSGDRDLKNW